MYYTLNSHNVTCHFYISQSGKQPQRGAVISNVTQAVGEEAGAGTTLPCCLTERLMAGGSARVFRGQNLSDEQAGTEGG